MPVEGIVALDQLTYRAAAESFGLDADDPHDHQLLTNLRNELTNV